MKTLTSTLWLAALSLGTAHADEAGTAWLQRIDAAAEVTDAHLQLDLSVTDAQGNTSQRTIEIWQKGTEQRLVRMVTPSRLKGVSLLVRPGGALHLFLPSYPPSRRVVGSKRSNAFMGTDFAMEDLSRMTFAGRFDATVAHTEGDLIQLALTPLEDTGSASLQVWVASSGVPVVHRIDHLDEAGTVTRRLTMARIQAVSGVHLAHEMTVEDLKRGRTTVALVQSVEIGGGLPDHLFTVTHLERP